MIMKKNHTNTLLYISVTVISLLFAGCSDNIFDEASRQHGEDRIQLSGDIDQLAVTRVNDNGFCDGDVMGVYIVDYEGGTPGTLKVSGNRGDNVRHTFDEPNYKWNSAYDLFWKDKHTHIDVYGYYPFANPESIDDYQFEVQRDQNRVSENGNMGGYEASDFLWGKVADVAPTTSVIRLPMKHRMSNACVTLVQGDGFANGEWANTEKIVLTTNVARKASINMADGTVSVAGGVEQTATIPSRVGDEWRTIVVPQTVNAGTTLFSITIGGVPYKFTKNENLTYISGKMMKFSIRVDKKAGSGKYSLTLISESITPWENDLVSHDATAKEYVVINSTPGGLKNAITAANKDYTKIKNLKITGEINAKDFYFMRDSMDILQALNLKDVRIIGTNEHVNDGWSKCINKDDQIPHFAFYGTGRQGKKSLNYLVLPDRLKSIGTRAFSGCEYLSGSLTIPEGVTEIQQGAFTACKSLTGSLSLPSTLVYIGNDDQGNHENIDYSCGTFAGCGFVGELNIPEGVKEIRGYAFDNCKGFYGNLKLPNNLEKLGERSFFLCKNLTGTLTIPQKIKIIPNECFNGCGFDGTLTLPNGITSIGNSAFGDCHFKGELSLPKDLRIINNNVFSNNDFSGELKLPKNISVIGEKAFAYNWRLMGTLEFPEGIQSIGAGAFAHCRSLEGLIFPKNSSIIC